MPYSYEWQGTQQHILSIGFVNEISDDDIQSLRAQFKPLLEETKPLLVLVELVNINIADSPMRFLRLLDGVPNSVLSYHASHSRLAILGGGYTIAMLLKMYAYLMEGHDPARVFDTREQALAWLNTKEQQASL